MTKLARRMRSRFRAKSRPVYRVALPPGSTLDKDCVLVPVDPEEHGGWGLWLCCTDTAGVSFCIPAVLDFPDSPDPGAPAPPPIGTVTIQGRVHAVYRADAGSNRRQTARPSRSRFRAKSRPGRLTAPRPSPRGPSASTCFQACCGVFEPDGTDCKGKDAKVTKPGTWSCMLNCLKIPDPNPARAGRRRAAVRPGRRRAAARPGQTLKGKYSYRRCDVLCSQSGYDNAACMAACIAIPAPHPGRAPNRLRRRAAARRRNPGPNGEALPVPPFCAAADCGRTDCGRCNPADYAVPGSVRTVLEAVAQMRGDVDYAVRTASQAERQMYAPGALAWADPSVAVLTKPGGPPPGNALPTAEWPHCGGPAVAADPSSNRQPNPGGTP